MKKVFTRILFSALFSTMCFAQWTQVPTSPPGWFQSIIVVNDTLYISSISNGIYKSTDGTATWQQINNGLNNTESRQVFEVMKFNSDLYAATIDGIYKSTNNGNEWIKKSNGITIGPGSLNEFCESVFEHEGVLYTGAWNAIYRSTNGAENWDVTNATGEGIRAKNFTKHDGKLFAARESNNFPDGYSSTNAGESWQPLTTISFPTITFFSEPPALWVGTIHGAWLSTDNGLSWVSRSNGLSPDPYNSSFVRINGQLITSLKFGGSGMFRSSDEGLNWENWGEGLPFLSSIEKLIVFKDKIIAATSNGLWLRDTSEVITALEEQNYLLHEFRLFQNYPNPFNPITSIQYAIGSMQFVQIKVYDIMGHEIATLVNEEKPAGNHEVKFNVAQVSRPEISSGVYFYRLRVGDPESSSPQGQAALGFFETKKMILLR